MTICRLNNKLLILGLFIIFIIAVNIYQFILIQREYSCNLRLNEIKKQENRVMENDLPHSPIYAVYGTDVDSGYLKHVFEIFQHYGFKRNYNVENKSDWDVLWAHDYPFQKLPHLKNLKYHQKVNHFPGTGFITNKIDLAMSKNKYIPKAFKIPHEKDELIQYSSSYPKKMFVQKSNDHRGIRITSIHNLNLKLKESFVQEYIDKPLLVDGYKFDIGVYTILTSVDPLRVYIYNGDVLFRYCTEKYYPFDTKNLKKYVIGDDYLPTWEVPSLKLYYNKFRLSMKESFNAYLQEIGKNSTIIWSRIEDAIRTVLLNREPLLMKIIQSYSYNSNFFELVRFDFVVDVDLNVYIMEVNMSPNLSSAHFLPNKLLYQQVLNNLFHLTGLTRMFSRSNNGILEIEVTDKNIAINSKYCKDCYDCVSPNCQLCLFCLPTESKYTLMESYLEHVNKHDCKRVFPPTGDELFDITNTELSPENLLLIRWFQFKCRMDKEWC